MEILILHFKKIKNRLSAALKIGKKNLKTGTFYGLYNVLSDYFGSKTYEKNYKIYIILINNNFLLLRLILI